MTARNGSTTYTVAANQGLYVGTIYIDSVAGQVTCHVSYGQSRKWSVSNAYNRQPIYLVTGDASASWTTANNTPHTQNANDFATLVHGLAEEFVSISYEQSLDPTSPIDTAGFGIGWNVTSAYSGQRGFINPSGTNIFAGFTAAYVAPPSLGRNDANALINATGTSITFLGTQANAQLIASYRG